MKYYVEHFEGPQTRVVSRTSHHTLVAAVARFNDIVSWHVSDPEVTVLLTAPRVSQDGGTVLASKSRNQINGAIFNARFFSDWAAETGPVDTGPELTPVLFRMEPNVEGDDSCIAVFPTIPTDDVGATMSCYSHIGQHGGCDYGYYIKTRPATEAEYADLKAELESYGSPDARYRLRVVHRLSKTLRDELLANVRRMRQAPGVQPCS